MKQETNEYVIKKKYEGQPICADPSTNPKENETGIHFSTGERSAWVSSYEPTVVEGLLQHNHFKIEELITVIIGKSECVVGVVGRLPIGSLNIGKKRSSDRHDLIVNNK